MTAADPDRTAGAGKLYYPASLGDLHVAPAGQAPGGGAGRGHQLPPAAAGRHGARRFGRADGRARRAGSEQPEDGLLQLRVWQVVRGSRHIVIMGRAAGYSALRPGPRLRFAIRSMTETIMSHNLPGDIRTQGALRPPS